jgi:hypothetical protein
MDGGAAPLTLTVHWADPPGLLRRFLAAFRLIREGNLSGAFARHQKGVGRALDLAQIAAHAVFGIRNEDLPCQLLKNIHRTDIVTPTAVRASFFPDLFNTHVITSMCGCLPSLLQKAKERDILFSSPARGGPLSKRCNCGLLSRVTNAFNKPAQVLQNYGRIPRK